MDMCEMCDFGLWTCCSGVNELNTITNVVINIYLSEEHEQEDQK